MWYRRLALSSKHTTAIVALCLNKSDAKRLSLNKNDVPEGSELESSDNMHITLVYLGEVKKIEKYKSLIEGVLGQFAKTHAPLKGTIGGIGCFAGSEKSPKPYYASYDAAELPVFREELVTALKIIGLPIDETHGFTPHITLAYLPYDTETVDILSKPSNLSLDSLTLCWADNKMHYKLKGSST